MDILEIKDLSFSYPNSKRLCVDHVSFSVREGEMVLLCGRTGSGKSTLLRLIKHALSPKGNMKGEVTVCGEARDKVPPHRVGFVMQRTDEQMVTDKVYSELAFGLESIGTDPLVIAAKVAETATYFGIEDKLYEDVSKLSGGQRQLLNIASVMTTDPDILILDEPTSQLDPIATSELYATIRRLNRDLSLTVIIVEHRLDELICECDRMIVMDNGSIMYDGAPRTVVSKIEPYSRMMLYMPPSARLHARLGSYGHRPLSVREGRSFIRENYGVQNVSLPRKGCTEGEAALELSSVYFRYGKDSKDVLRGLDLTVYKNEIFCLFGGNGSGKTTALHCALGTLSPYAGKIKLFGKRIRQYTDRELHGECISMLPQDVQCLFLKNTVREELSDAGIDIDCPDDLFDMRKYADMHPYDLSGGEQQMLGLMKVMAGSPRILVLDEPTNALDAEKKARLKETLQKIKERGVTLLIVTHDIEFASECADRCAMLFDGRIVSCAEPREMLPKNRFYTTCISKMTKGYFEGAVTVDDAFEICRKCDLEGKA